jgi:hypothetical protein
METSDPCNVYKLIIGQALAPLSSATMQEHGRRRKSRHFKTTHPAAFRLQPGRNVGFCIIYILVMMRIAPFPEKNVVF